MVAQPLLSFVAVLISVLPSLSPGPPRQLTLTVQATRTRDRASIGAPFLGFHPLSFLSSWALRTRRRPERRNSLAPTPLSFVRASPDLKNVSQPTAGASEKGEAATNKETKPADATKPAAASKETKPAEGEKPPVINPPSEIPPVGQGKEPTPQATESATSPAAIQPEAPQLPKPSQPQPQPQPQPQQPTNASASAPPPVVNRTVQAMSYQETEPYAEEEPYFYENRDPSTLYRREIPENVPPHVQDGGLLLPRPVSTAFDPGTPDRFKTSYIRLSDSRHLMRSIERELDNTMASIRVVEHISDQLQKATEEMQADVKHDIHAKTAVFEGASKVEEGIKEATDKFSKTAEDLGHT